MLFDLGDDAALLGEGWEGEASFKKPAAHATWPAVPDMLPLSSCENLLNQEIHREFFKERPAVAGLRTWNSVDPHPDPLVSPLAIATFPFSIQV